MDTYIITKDQLKAIVNKHPEEYYSLAKQIQKQSIAEDGDCILCGGSLKEYWHKITPILVNSLVVAYKVVAKRQANYFNKHELELDHSEYGNFQKLRFHALIARYKVDGDWKKGDWLITSRGFKFLQGKIAIPKRVKTYKNKVIDHDTELVYLKDVVGSDPYMETDFDFEVNEPDQSLLF